MDNDQKQPAELQVIPAPAAAPAERLPDGKFLPGHTISATNSYKRAFTKKLSEQLGKLIDEGGAAANPLVAAHTIMMDPAEKTIHRLYAAKMLLRVIFPQAINLSMESDDPEALAVESKKVTETLTAYFGRKAD